MSKKKEEINIHGMSIYTGDSSIRVHVQNEYININSTMGILEFVHFLRIGRYNIDGRVMIYFGLNKEQIIEVEECIYNAYVSIAFFDIRYIEHKLSNIQRHRLIQESENLITRLKGFGKRKGDSE